MDAYNIESGPRAASADQCAAEERRPNAAATSSTIQVDAAVETTELQSSIGGDREEKTSRVPQRPFLIRRLG